MRMNTPIPRLLLPSGSTAVFLPAAHHLMPVHTHCSMRLQCCLEPCGAGAVRQPERARTYFQTGLRRCPSSIVLWQLAALLEEELAGPNKARSMLELARLRNAK